MPNIRQGRLPVWEQAYNYVFLLEKVVYVEEEDEDDFSSSYKFISIFPEIAYWSMQ